MAYIKIRIRGDTAANWSARNPILEERELAVEVVPRSSTPWKMKIGDGQTPWNDLPYSFDYDAVHSLLVETRSYTRGDTNSRENEEYDNAQHYSNQAKQSERSANNYATQARQSKDSAGQYYTNAIAAASNAAQSASDAQGYKEDVSDLKDEIQDIIENSLLANSEQILDSVEDYFRRAEALYRSCTIVCDGEKPHKRVRTIIDIDCFTIARRLTEYTGIDFDGGTPAIRLLGE